MSSEIILETIGYMVYVLIAAFLLGILSWFLSHWLIIWCIPSFYQAFPNGSGWSSSNINGYYLARGVVALFGAFVGASTVLTTLTIHAYQNRKHS
jgi:hypothetical protein